MTSNCASCQWYLPSDVSQLGRPQDVFSSDSGVEAVCVMQDTVERTHPNKLATWMSEPSAANVCSVYKPFIKDANVSEEQNFKHVLESIDSVDLTEAVKLSELWNKIGGTLTRWANQSGLRGTLAGIKRLYSTAVSKVKAGAPVGDTMDRFRQEVVRLGTRAVGPNVVKNIDSTLGNVILENKMDIDAVVTNYLAAEEPDAIAAADELIALAGECEGEPCDPGMDAPTDAPMDGPVDEPVGEPADDMVPEDDFAFESKKARRARKKGK